MDCWRSQEDRERFIAEMTVGDTVELTATPASLWAPDMWMRPDPFPVPPPSPALPGKPGELEDLVERLGVLERRAGRILDDITRREADLEELRDELAEIDDLAAPLRLRAKEIWAEINEIKQEAGYD